MGNRKIAVLSAVLLIGAMLLNGCSGTENGAEETATPPATSGGEAVALAYVEEFDKNSIMTFAITVDAEAWAALLENANDKEYIAADVTINGTTIENVGIRAKGNSSLSSVARDADSDRYSFKIKFDEYVDGQTWMGLDKMVINGNYADATSMKEYLSYDIMSYIGVDTPLYCYADISVNGESWGFYLAIEDTEDSYLERVYGGEGVLYKPDNDTMGDMANMPDMADMPDFQEGEMPGMENMPDMGNAPDMAEGEPPEGFTPPAGTGDATGDASGGSQGSAPSGGRGNMDGGMGGGMASGGVSLQYTDDELESYSAIFDNNKTKADAEDNARVVTALKNLSEGTELEIYVDVDAVLRYFAAHTVVVNLDSYVSNMAHNYILYENGGQISILPWDYNMAFGGFQSGNASDAVNFPIDTPVSGVSMEDRPLLFKLLEVPEYLAQYHQYLQQIIDGYFLDGQFEATVDALDAMIASYVKADPSAFYTYDEYQAAIVELKEFGALRAESVQGQLDGTIPSTAEGQAADSSNLIDASSVDLALMGSQNGMGGGMGGNRGDMSGMPDGLDADATRQAMAIIQAAGGAGLTDTQKEELYALGLTDEQIEQLLQMGSGGGRPSGEQGLQPPAE